MESENLKINLSIREILAILDSHRELLSAAEIETLDKAKTFFPTGKKGRLKNTLNNFFRNEEIITATAFIIRLLIKIFSEE